MTLILNVNNNMQPVECAECGYECESHHFFESLCHECGEVEMQDKIKEEKNEK